ncbi:MAG TPA: GNAT family N-acetyltransferase [Methylomirabilota bacterium]|nr:GNAT family N-acetyltransferase [Methylomirabilota bacterium]
MARAGAGLPQLDRALWLRDGTPVRLRPIVPEDASKLVALYDRLSRDTRYHRFFSAMRRLPIDWARFLANVDYRTRLALVAESPDEPGALIAVARYEPAGAPDTAEVALVVQDDWQNRGLGTALFRELLRAAAANGIPRLRAWVLADNRRMLDLIARLGRIEQQTLEQGVVELTFTAPPSTPPGTRA